MPPTLLSADEFVRLRSSEKQEEYLAAAHGTASDDVWMDVIERYPDYARWVAHNKTIPVSIIRLLAAHVDSDVRNFIAAKRKTPPEILSILSGDVDEDVRRRVAFNAKATREVLELLFDDPISDIKETARRRLGEYRKGIL